jgi:hypothetical protein
MKTFLKFSGLATVLLIGGFLMGCQSTPIEKTHPDRWDKTYAGMSLDDFKEVWPNAKYAGEDQGGGEIYTVSSPYLPYSFPSVEYFIFDRDNKLLKWRNGS